MVAYPHSMDKSGGCYIEPNADRSEGHIGIAKELASNPTLAYRCEGSARSRKIFENICALVNFRIFPYGEPVTSVSLGWATRY